MNAESFLEREFFQGDFLDCARGLIGCELVWKECAGIIVETEAYAVHNDEACHTFARPSARAFVENHSAGTAYVYLNYGVHWLLNVLVKGGKEDGLILIRALEPTRGLRQMERRRGTSTATALCSGPGKLSQALGIRGSDHSRNLCGTPRIGFRKGALPVTVITDTRIGISKAVDFPWRFLLHDNAHISVKASPRSLLATKSTKLGI